MTIPTTWMNLKMIKYNFRIDYLGAVVLLFGYIETGSSIVSMNEKTGETFEKEKKNC